MDWMFLSLWIFSIMLSSVQTQEDKKDEAWSYVNFLRNEVSDKVETILQETLTEAKGESDKMTVQLTLEQVMEIRESFLERIKNLRTGSEPKDSTQNIKQEENLSELRMEIMSIILKLLEKDAANIDQLKEITKALLRFRLMVSNEIMRILMLPENPNTRTAAPPGNCNECASLEQISLMVEDLVSCVTGDEDDADEYAIKCSGEFMNDLLAIIDAIDSSIKYTYNVLVVTTAPKDRKRLFIYLSMIKGIRNDIDELLTGLGSGSEEDIKKMLERKLTPIKANLKSKVQECKSEYCPGDCPSCGARLLVRAVSKMDEINEILQSELSDEDAMMETIRLDTINYINDLTSEDRELLKKKAKEGPLEECEEEQRMVFDKIKLPLWMLVNTTIHVTEQRTEVVTSIVETLKNEMNKLINTFCKQEPLIKKAEEFNCNREEYDQTKSHLESTDNIIQEALFKGNDDDARLNAILGFVDLQDNFNKRIQTLFEEKLRCSEEVDFIKKSYMPKLNECMSKLMNPRQQYGKQRRTERISCVKTLRSLLEDRKSELLRNEVQRSLDNLKEDEESLSDSESIVY